MYLIMYLSKKTKKRGFTLIELLVVISIISLLSSIVLVSLSDVKDKARIAGAEYFLGHIKGSQFQVGNWKLDSAVSSVVIDQSQSDGNNGTVNGGVSCDNNGYKKGKGSCAFDRGGYISIPTTDKSSLNFSPDDSFTLSAWIRTTTKDHMRVISAGHFDMSQGFVLQVTDNAGSGSDRDLYAVAGIGKAGELPSNESAIYVRTQKGGLADGKWHLITATFNASEKKLMIYIDGVISPLTDVVGRPMGSNSPSACGTFSVDKLSLDYSNCNHISPSVYYNTLDGEKNVPVCIGSTSAYSPTPVCGQYENFKGEISEPLIFKDVINSKW